MLACFFPSHPRCPEPLGALPLRAAVCTARLVAHVQEVPALDGLAVEVLLPDVTAVGGVLQRNTKGNSAVVVPGRLTRRPKGSGEKSRTASSFANDSGSDDDDDDDEENHDDDDDDDDYEFGLASGVGVKNLSVVLDVLILDEHGSAMKISKLPSLFVFPVGTAASNGT